MLTSSFLGGNVDNKIVGKFVKAPLLISLADQIFIKKACPLYAKVPSGEMEGVMYTNVGPII